MLWLLIALYLTIIIQEVPSLVENQMYKELGIFGLVFIIGVYMTLAQLYEWPLPNPFEPWIQMLAYISTSGLIYL
jgi:hypothetical protein